PALGQIAVAQGELAAKNIIALIKNHPLKELDITLKGTLVSLGQWYATGKIGPLFIRGRLAWWLWRTIYLMKLLSWRKRLLVVTDWTMHLLSPRDISDV
ncbi:MAG: NAD(P)/FAD-dependent oxidoreductase, partial [Candidatus Magasanikbacteria bacterium CG10_big_fil_rev_8_21_14_0_10_43_6]